MKIESLIKYDEEYVPYKCRKPRYKECQEYVELELQQAKKEDLKLAFEDKSYSGRGKIYYYNNQLWCLPEIRNNIDKLNKPTVSSIKSGFYKYCRSYKDRWNEFEKIQGNERDNIIKARQAALDEYLLVDRTIYEKISEPRYCVVTFGLGHNHGGTGMFCDYYYNSNLSHKAYFNANQGKEAVEEANRVAKNRGDTKDVGKFKPFIKVYMPEIVKCNPAKDHGDGDPFLNKLYAVTEGTDSAFEAGLLALAVTANEIG